MNIDAIEKFAHRGCAAQADVNRILKQHSCRFYGRSHVGLLHGALIDQHGNECAAISDSFSPCTMEYPLNETPDETVCSIAQAYLHRSIG